MEGIFEDMIKTEAILARHGSGFLNRLANEVYKLQSHALLVGPEGTYLGALVDKKGQEYDEIIGKAREHSSTATGKMIGDLDKENFSEPMDVLGFINEKLSFGILSDKHIVGRSIKRDNRDYQIFQLVFDNDKEKEARINKIIEEDLEKHIENLEHKDDLVVNTYVSFQGSQYLSYNGYIYYENRDQDENQEDLSFSRTFDYINESYLSLEDYLGIDLPELKDYLSSSKGIEIDHSPDFQLSDMGIDLMIKDTETRESYHHLSKKDLMAYLDLDKLISD